MHGVPDFNWPNVKLRLSGLAIPMYLIQNKSNIWEFYSTPMHHLKIVFLKNARLFYQSQKHKITQKTSYYWQNTCSRPIVISHLDYGDALFADLPSSTIKPAQLVQNHAAKVILGLWKFDSATTALKELGTLASNTSKMHIFSNFFYWSTTVYEISAGLPVKTD